jgi:hypothetical protein
MSLEDIKDEILLSDDELEKSFEYYKSEFELDDEVSAIIVDRAYFFGDKEAKVFYTTQQLEDGAEFVELDRG